MQTQIKKNINGKRSCDNIYDEEKKEPIVEKNQYTYKQYNNGHATSQSKRCKSDHIALNFLFRTLGYIMRSRDSDVFLQCLTTIINSTTRHKSLLNNFVSIAVPLFNLYRYIGYQQSNIDNEIIKSDVVCICHDTIGISHIISATFSYDVHVINSVNKYESANLIYHKESLEELDLSFCKNKFVILISTESEQDLEKIIPYIKEFVDVGITFFWSINCTAKQFTISSDPDNKIEYSQPQLYKLYSKKSTYTLNNDMCTSPHYILEQFFILLSLQKEEPNMLLPIGKFLFGRNKIIKEIIENMAAIHNVLHYIETYFGSDSIINDTHIVALCHGDGHQPRCAYLLSMKTKWDVHSIDPEMKLEWTKNNGVANLSCHRSVIEDVDLDFCKDKTVILIGVHSHANLDSLWERLDSIAKNKIALSIPCCKHVVHTIAKETVVNMYEREIPNKGVCKQELTNCHIMIWSDY
jgi:hypothetical protein